MNLLIDLIVIAIVGLSVLISAKRGFVKVLIEVAGFVAAIIVTFTISTPLADNTYDKIIEPPIVEAAVNAVGESAQHEAWNALPEFVTENALKLGVSGEDFTGKITENLASGTEAAVKTASQDIIKPIITKILGLIY